MKPKDWTLLVIATALHEGGKPLEPVQLQKSLFLIGRKLPPRVLGSEPFYSFRAYDYGPFSEAVYHDAEQLESDGLAAITRPPESRFKLYAPTERGANHAQELQRALAPPVAGYVGAVVKYTQSLTFSELVSSIYRVYPEMKEHSVFRD